MPEQVPQIIDGKATAAKHLKRLAEASSEPLGIGIIVATDDPATKRYISGKRLAAEQLGWRCEVTQLGPTASLEEIATACQAFNQNQSIDGYIVQLPLPAGVDSEKVFAAVDVAKDADGLTRTNLDRLYAGAPAIIPATSKGILSLLEDYHIPIAGRTITVVGQGELTGKPLAALLEQKDALVTRADKDTTDLAAATRTADILVVATGNAGLITGEMVKSGVVVIDVGINKSGAGIVGDVDYESVSRKVSAITPVPGGVGPMTVASLLENVYELSQQAG